MHLARRRLILALIPRAIWSVIAIWLVSTLSFFVSRAAPGGPFDNLLRLGAHARDNQIVASGLDDPLLVQYGRFLSGFWHGDFGESLVLKGVPVVNLLSESIVVSISIAIPALVIGIVFGSLAAVFAVIQNFSDGFFRIFLALALTLPAFLTAPLLSLFFAVWLGWLPAGGVHAGLPSFVLPCLVLTLPIAAMVCLLLLEALRERMSSPDILASRAKGLGTSQLVRSHALPSAVIPVLNFLAPTVALALAGAVVTETVFDIPGSGRLFIQSALARDYPVVVALATFVGLLIIGLNLLADALTLWLDPRTNIRGLEP